MKHSDKEIKEFVEKFHKTLPDPINYPKTTLFYWKVFKQQKEQNKELVNIDDKHIKILDLLKGIPNEYLSTNLGDK